jgi:hypothetical protein
MKLEFSRPIFEKSSSFLCHKTPSSESLAVPRGHTEMTKLIVVLRISRFRLNRPGVYEANKG